jgi:hypothetical protein
MSKLSYPVLNIPITQRPTIQAAEAQGERGATLCQGGGWGLTQIDQQIQKTCICTLLLLLLLLILILLLVLILNSYMNFILEKRYDS